ncbi:uncharacterized protein LOC123831668 [Phyllostomus hastatus]|uniref:uncharacterized protein LOC123831668 n=1 Tax=Phyllostomus hastatus TaxID=9423 RepID=UPI001E680508|nr:uncharacterized protein LOC123831668 [Phyllostomus hastatus]
MEWGEAVALAIAFDPGGTRDHGQQGWPLPLDLNRTGLQLQLSLWDIVLPPKQVTTTNNAKEWVVGRKSTFDVKDSAPCGRNGAAASAGFGCADCGPCVRSRGPPAQPSRSGMRAQKSKSENEPRSHDPAVGKRLCGLGPGPGPGPELLPCLSAPLYNGAVVRPLRRALLGEGNPARQDLEGKPQPSRSRARTGVGKSQGRLPALPPGACPPSGLPHRCPVRGLEPAHWDQLKLTRGAQALSLFLAKNRSVSAPLLAATTAGPTLMRVGPPWVDRASLQTSVSPAAQGNETATRPPRPGCEWKEGGACSMESRPTGRSDHKSLTGPVTVGSHAGPRPTTSLLKGASVS